MIKHPYHQNGIHNDVVVDFFDTGESIITVFIFTDTIDGSIM